MLDYNNKRIIKRNHRKVLGQTYVVSSKTLALVPLRKEKRLYTIIIEEDGQHIIKKSPLRVIKDSLMTYGTTYEEVLRLSQRNLAIQQKLPICIKTAQDIVPINIFFPTESPSVHTNVWISLDAITGFNKKKNGELIVHLRNDQSLLLNLSEGALHRQVANSHLLYKKASELYSSVYTEPSDAIKKQAVVWLFRHALKDVKE